MGARIEPARALDKLRGAISKKRRGAINKNAKNGDTVSAPKPQDYDVVDVQGTHYTWQGADPSAITGVMTWSDNAPDTDLVMLKCRSDAGDVFVNALHVVSLTPKVKAS